MEGVRLNLQTVDWFLFGVISHQFYLYWISGEFVGWSKISSAYLVAGFKDSRRVKWAFLDVAFNL